MHRLRTPFFFAAIPLLPALATAQTVLSGNVSDATTGPLQTGVVYHVPGGITVPFGDTLTIGPGAILKFGAGGSFQVNGTVLSNGSSTQPVILTALADDSAGGDTNGDGPSSGSPGAWIYWRFASTASASDVRHTVVRFAGAGGWNPIRLDGCAATFRECTIEDNLGAGFQLTGALAAPTIAGCTIRNNSGWAIDGARFESVFNIANNVATGNGANGVLITNGTLAADTVVHARSGINGVLALLSSVNVPAGRTLTLGRGVVLKHVAGGAIEVGGTLNCQGTPGQPVVVTSFTDDTFGGDSNGDGPSSGAPGEWPYVRFHAGSSASTLNHAILRYGGGGAWSPIRVENASPTFTNCVVEHAPSRAVVLASTAGAPTISGCTFRNNGGWAIEAAGFESVVNLASNTATNNGSNNVLILGASLTGDVAVAPQMGFGGVLCLLTTVNIGVGRTLTLEAGTVLKHVQSGAFEVSGALVANGTAAQPVVITSFADDTYGGDSNGDGPSVGAPGQWIYMRFYATSSASSLRHAILRNGGGGGWSTVRIEGGSPTLRDCTIERAQGLGVSFAGTLSQARLDRCTIRDCGGAALSEIRIDSLPFITRLAANGNGANQVAVTGGTLSGDVYLDGNMGLDGVVVLHTTLTAPVGRKLTLGPGAILKMAPGQQVNVLGALDVLATRERPVVFTASSDDSIGGDSDGPTAAPTPGFWTWFLLDELAAPCRIENLVVRYGGASGWPALRARSPLAELRHVRVERAQSVGFELLDAARAEFLTAWSCGGTGISLAGGDFDVERATAASCASGIVRSGAWGGLVRNSIAWGNTIDNVSGMLVGQISYSNGVSGGLGNSSVDPLFVDSAQGDLRLLPASSCIDAGDPGSPKDADCTRADMGSAPSDAAPQSYCAGKLNSLGCTPYLGYSGFARATAGDPLVVRCFNVLSGRTGLFFYGFSGRSNAPFQGGLKCVADPVRRTPLQSSGGIPGLDTCTGVFEFDVTAYMASGADPLLAPGASVTVQSWHRDPGVPSGTGLSDGLEFTVCN